ncbi:UDP-glucose 4-epimerase [Haloactinopolyspora alba]|uniref:UDP-glucose 4-epimerase n=2 Tax=Haloactinopolyspora alba TaxID=648780 RepID=A0A2P8DJW3_9ACTN|nr:UDP-glucose 4-epimerase [Haloactinopolyspora alba]
MVVGVARHLGALLAEQLSHDDRVDRVVGIDVVPPDDDIGDAEFVRADIRTSDIGRVMQRVEPDTVVHMNILATRSDAGGRSPQKEINVIGTMQLLAACQRAASVRTVVVKSSTTVYGAGAHAPALFTEDMVPGALARGGYEKDASEVEAYVRGFSRRRPDVHVSILRFANVLGPTIRTALSEYFALPAVPFVAGRDPRFQLVHEQDCLDALRHTTLGEHTGIVNVAGDGFLVLSQALARAGRPAVPLPTLGTPLVGGLMRRTGVADMDSAQVRFLTHGRGVDTTRMREQLGFEPAYSTMATFDEFVRARVTGGFDSHAVLAAARQVRTRLADGLGHQRGQP